MAVEDEASPDHLEQGKSDQKQQYAGRQHEDDLLAADAERWSSHHSPFSHGAKGSLPAATVIRRWFPAGAVM
jgi:hypothetical protein